MVDGGERPEVEVDVEERLEGLVEGGDKASSERCFCLASAIHAETEVQERQLGAGGVSSGF